MVEAFKSTLEELTYADLVLLLIDASEPLETVRIKYESCRNVMEQMHINPARVLVILNKIDLVQKEQLSEKMSMLEGMPAMSISAKSGDGTRKLKLRIVAKVFEESTLEPETPDVGQIQTAGSIDTNVSGLSTC